MAVNNLALLFTRVVKFPNHLLGFVCSEGSWTLAYPTNIIVEHFTASRSSDDASKIRQQLSQPFFQSRWNKGRINPIFYDLLDPESLLNGEDYQGESLFRVEMRVESKKQFANVEFVNGRLFSVELPKPIEFYKGKEITFGAVTKGKTSQSFTPAIDRSEHGRDPNES